LTSVSYSGELPDSLGDLVSLKFASFRNNPLLVGETKSIGFDVVFDDVSAIKKFEGPVN